MPMTRWEFRIGPCLAGGNASATCLKMLVMRFADVQWPAPWSLHRMFKAHYKCQVIIIIITKRTIDYYYYKTNINRMHRHPPGCVHIHMCTHPVHICIYAHTQKHWLGRTHMWVLLGYSVAAVNARCVRRWWRHISICQSLGYLSIIEWIISIINFFHNS